MRKVKQGERWGSVLVAILAMAQLGSGARADMLNVVATPLVPAPEISVTPPSLSLGCEGTFAITIASAGPAGSTLEISALALTHGYSQGYYGTGFGWDLDGITPPVSLPSGATLAIPVTFSAIGQTFPSRLELRIDSNAANTPHLFQVHLGAALLACEATHTPTPTVTETASETATETPTLTPTSNRPFLIAVARAVPDPATSGATVTLDGSESSGAYVSSYAWAQIAGSAVTLADADTALATFVAPPVLVPTTLTFELYITGLGGSPPSTSASSTVDVVIEPISCLGDCDEDGQVTVDELVLGVDIALGRDTADSCRAMDENGDQAVSVVELVRAVGSALDGCACGDREVMDRFPSCVAAEAEGSCLAAGGVWTRVGLSLEPTCLCPTGQEGCPCSRITDCLGACVGPLKGFPDNCAAARGSCASEHPTVGCRCWFDENGNARALCAD